MDANFIGALVAASCRSHNLDVSEDEKARIVTAAIRAGKDAQQDAILASMEKGLSRFKNAETGLPPVYVRRHGPLPDFLAGHM